MRLLLIGAAYVVAACLPARADLGESAPSANAILERVLVNRPTSDFSLKARLFVTREKAVPVEILVRNTAEDTRTIYRSGSWELLVVQSVRGGVRFYLRGAGELTGEQRMQKVLGSNFSYYDLGVPFLHWPNARFLGEEITRGRNCFILEVTADSEPYARVKIWIDKQYNGLLRAEAFDENGTRVRRFAITSFRRVGDVWIPRALEIAFVPPGQSLPSEDKSRLEVYEGNYTTQLPAEWFSPDRR
jgi:hypothetical protein